MTLQTGSVVEGKYRIIRLLGEGGMGAVYEGDNTRIHRRVAIKVLHAAVAAKADVVQRFEREAQAAGRIGSEHIVEVLDLGNLPGGERFMVMEYLEGESLGERIKKRMRLTPQEVAPLMQQLLQGLAAAHHAGIIDRDLKPDNVFICTQRGSVRDFVKVLDFGVSKFSALDNEMSMTKTGAVMGTPFYMSPEQARGGKIDPRSDLYSVGVVMYQAVTGRVPFHAETFNELVFKIALESPEPAELVAPGLDLTFAQIIARAMVREPNGRFQSAQEFQAAINQWVMTGQSAPMPSGIGQGYGSPQTMLLPQHQGQMGQSAPNMLGQSAPNFLGQSHPALRQSYGQLGQSHPSMPQGAMPQHMMQSGAPLGMSQGGHPMGMSQGGHPMGMSQGQHPMGLSQGGSPLGASQGGLAMTSPQKSGSGAVIAFGIIGLLVLAGGSFGAYHFLGGGAATATTDTTADAAHPAAPANTAPAAAAPAPSGEAAAPAPAAPAPPAAAATSAETPEPTVADAPVAEAPHPGGHPVATVHRPVSVQRAPPVVQPPPYQPPPPPPPKANGRAIGGEL